MLADHNGIVNQVAEHKNSQVLFLIYVEEMEPEFVGDPQRERKHAKMLLYLAWTAKWIEVSFTKMRKPWGKIET